MNSQPFTLSGNLVDVWRKEIYPAVISVKNGKITSITPIRSSAGQSFRYILPGFIDSHVHVESSMLVPGEFAKLAVTHGTVATVSDPHEIANVCGWEGVEFMIENGGQVNFKFNFGAPSCVPATTFETAGAALDSEAVKKLLEKDGIRYLSEMMNFPGVLFKEEEVMKKIAAAHGLGKPVDGHAPGLRGEQAKQYIDAGISTDHECFTADEALDKLKYGMKIQIREGSAAKNFDALIDLLNEYPDKMMFCSDDKHPDSLAAGHINQLCARAVAKGIDLFRVLQAACINPVLHYKLDVGLLREGDPADFIVADDLVSFKIRQTYINGELVAENGLSFIQPAPVIPINRFDCREITAEQLKTGVNDYPSAEGKIPVIEALDGQLITNRLMLEGKEKDGTWVSDVTRDILKMVVINRYFPAPVAKAFIRNFGFHSHNIVAVGADDESLARAINLVIRVKGGVSCVKPSSASVVPANTAMSSVNTTTSTVSASNTGSAVPAASATSSAAGDGFEELVLGLPVAGLMSAEDGYQVAAAYTAIDLMAKNLGSKLGAPFMTLSFMALLVIPHIKLSDKGLFDGDKFVLMG
jgi:adenine deaminase